MYKQDRAFIFPRSIEAVALVESEEVDSRFEIELLDLSYDQYGKLKLFGFFDFPKETGFKITKNSFEKIESENIHMLIDSALRSRKEIKDKILLKVIDQFVEKAKRSANEGLPIWVSA